MTEVLSITVTDEVAAEVERLRQQERRSVSQMGSILIDEALIARIDDKRKKPKP